MLIYRILITPTNVFRKLRTRDWHCTKRILIIVMDTNTYIKCQNLQNILEKN